jgi:hypothetical protein
VQARAALLKISNHPENLNYLPPVFQQVACAISLDLLKTQTKTVSPTPSNVVSCWDAFELLVQMVPTYDWLLGPNQDTATRIGNSEGIMQSQATTDEGG